MMAPGVGPHLRRARHGTCAVMLLVSAGVSLSRCRLEPASIQLSRASITFSMTLHGAGSESQAIEVTNGGDGTVGGLLAMVTYVVPPRVVNGWLTASLGSATTPSSLTLTRGPVDWAEGTYTATVTVSSPDAANSPQVVNVTFIVAAPPARRSLR